MLQRPDKKCATMVEIPGSIMGDKEIKTLKEFGIKYDFNFVVATFVKSMSDVESIRKVLGKEGSGIQIISKIDNREGLMNFE